MSILNKICYLEVFLHFNYFANFEKFSMNFCVTLFWKGLVDFFLLMWKKRGAVTGNFEGHRENDFKFVVASH